MEAQSTTTPAQPVQQLRHCSGFEHPEGRLQCCHWFLIDKEKSVTNKPVRCPTCAKNVKALQISISNNLKRRQKGIRQRISRTMRMRLERIMDGFIPPYQSIIPRSSDEQYAIDSTWNNTGPAACASQQWPKGDAHVWGNNNKWSPVQGTKCTQCQVELGAIRYSNDPAFEQHHKQPPVFAGSAQGLCKQAAPEPLSDFNVSSDDEASPSATMLESASGLEVNDVPAAPDQNDDSLLSHTYDHTPQLQNVFQLAFSCESLLTEDPYAADLHPVISSTEVKNSATARLLEQSFSTPSPMRQHVGGAFLLAPENAACHTSEKVAGKHRTDHDKSLHSPDERAVLDILCNLRERRGNEDARNTVSKKRGPADAVERATKRCCVVSSQVSRRNAFWEDFVTINNNTLRCGYFR